MYSLSESLLPCRAGGEGCQRFGCAYNTPRKLKLELQLKLKLKLKLATKHRTSWPG
jgi:hypothetical protein